jgi:dihydrofolate reductase
MNITLDGFIAGRQGELDWHFGYWNEEMARYAGEQLSRTDTILVGRITYEAMEKYWPKKAMDLSFPREDIAFAGMMNGHRKIVFSNTLKKVNWNNSVLIGGEIRRKVKSLKQQKGLDMIIYGSGSIVAALAGWELVDEYLFWLHPVVIGKGKKLFNSREPNHKLRLKDTILFSTGVLLLQYNTIRQEEMKEQYQEKLLLED